MRGLRPCTSCQRHVRNGDKKCPFCGAPFESGPPLPALRYGRRIARATVAAATISAAPLGVACTTAALPQDAYGAPPIADAMTDAGLADFGITDAAYGAPPVDAMSADAEAVDATRDAGVPSDADGVPADDVGFPSDAYGGAPDAMEDTGVSDAEPTDT